MSLLSYFKSSKPKSASVAKQRLQILVAHERASRNQPSYVPRLEQELLSVIRKYVEVDQDAITVKFEQDGNQETLEVNVVLPDEKQVETPAKTSSNAAKRARKKAKARN